MRFSLRSILILMTFLVLGFAVIARSIRKQSAAVRAIRNHGGSVTYSVSPNFGWVPEFVHDRLGQDLFHVVTAVDVNSQRDPEGPIHVLTNPERNDQVWEHVANLQHVRSLVMNDGGIAPESLKEIAKLQRLRDLSFVRVALTDDAIKYLAALNELRNVELYEAGLSDESVGVFAEMKSLRCLALTGCHLSDHALEVIAKSDSIAELSFADSTLEITDDGAAALAKMQRLKHVDLKGSQLTDAGLRKLGENPGIKVFYVGNTNVTWKEADAFKKTMRPDVKFEGGGLR